MTLDEAFAELRRRHEPAPTPVRLPTKDEVDAAERRAGRKFPLDFRRYLLEASDVNVGTLEPACITCPEAWNDLFNLLDDAEEMELPVGLLPICQDNGDFYALNEKGEVVFWSHDGVTDEKWRNLAHWIEQVWLGGEEDE